MRPNRPQKAAREDGGTWWQDKTRKNISGNYYSLVICLYSPGIIETMGESRITSTISRRNKRRMPRRRRRATPTRGGRFTQNTAEGGGGEPDKPTTFEKALQKESADRKTQEEILKKSET